MHARSHELNLSHFTSFIYPISTASSQALRPLRRTEDIFRLLAAQRRVRGREIRELRVARPVKSDAAIEAGGIDAEDAADVVAVAGDGEFAESVAPFVEEAADGFADFVFAVFRVVAGARDGVDGPGRGAVLE